MARYATLKLTVDPKTGKRELIVGYQSDEDALAREHESEHRKLAVGVAGSDAVKKATRVSKRGPTDSGSDDDGGLPQAIEQDQ
jgi:hypothetical protein